MPGHVRRCNRPRDSRRLMWSWNTRTLSTHSHFGGIDRLDGRENAGILAIEAA